MGWTGQYLDRDLYPSRLSTHEIIRLSLGSEFSTRVVDCAKVGSVVYGACRTHVDLSVVFGLVILTETRREGDGRWLYTKELDDTMGPAEDRCPERILDLLTPTESDYANQWRQRCRDYHAKRASAKLTRGEVVEFTQPWNFTNGASSARLRYAGKGTQFWTEDGYLVGLPRDWFEREHRKAAA